MKYIIARRKEGSSDDNMKGYIDFIIEDYLLLFLIAEGPDAFLIRLYYNIVDFAYNIITKGICRKEWEYIDISLSVLFIRFIL